jgi:hypothetical protein
MSEKQSFWTVFNAVLGGVAAIVTAGTGLYLALRSESATTAAVNVPVVSADVAANVADDAVEGVAYDRTPWVGVELRQNEKSVRLQSAGGSWERFEAKLAPGPFELLVTRKADDPNIGILAWHDDTIFKCVQDGVLHLPGTGIAGAQFAVPILYLDQQGFNYYDTERMKRVADDKYAIFISTIGSGELELPLARFAGPLYLIVFRSPREFSMEVPSHDFEMITLQR